jgi:hypothetical protein
MSSLEAATCAAAQRNHSFAWGGYFAAITASISEFGTTPRDRLARILRFRCINRPARLPFVDRRVDDNEVIFSRNNKAVVAAPGRKLHVRRELDQLQAGCGRRKIDHIAVKKERVVSA